MQRSSWITAAVASTVAVGAFAQEEESWTTGMKECVERSEPEDRDESRTRDQIVADCTRQTRGVQSNSVTPSEPADGDSARAEVFGTTTAPRSSAVRSGTAPDNTSNTATSSSAPREGSSNTPPALPSGATSTPTPASTQSPSPPARTPVTSPSNPTSSNPSNTPTTVTSGGASSASGGASSASSGGSSGR